MCSTVTTLGFCLTWLASVTLAKEAPIVATKYGQLRGAVWTIDESEKEAFVYLNIPYAAPPVGDLRFRGPQEPEAWEGVRDATQYGLPCAQIASAASASLNVELSIDIPRLTNMSEDCLQLNVYTSDVTGSRPVMLFIHGGGFMAGYTGGLSEMHVYAIREDIVGIDIQYRLGALGFLSTDDDAAVGNYGFKDQVAALQWVQENIAAFGGDPNQVTIFGESAGALSVSMLLLSPLGEGLFHRGILQSGSIIDVMAWAPPVVPWDEAVKLANLLGCPNTTSEELVEFMRTLPAEQVMDPNGTGDFDPLAQFIFWPKTEEGVIPDIPANLLDQGLFHKNVDIIAGVTKEEGYMTAKMFLPDYWRPDFSLVEFRDAVYQLMTVHFPESPSQWLLLTEAAMSVYADSEEEGESLSYAFARFIGDSQITFSTYKMARGIQENGNQSVYFYEFATRPSLSIRPENITADHADDLLFTFGSPYTGRAHTVPANFTEQDRLVGDILMRYWANFAKTGDPNDEGLVEWPEKREGEAYLVITPQPFVDYNFAPERMTLWLETLPDIAHGDEGGGGVNAAQKPTHFVHFIYIISIYIAIVHKL